MDRIMQLFRDKIKPLKVKASSLVETLIATIIIMIVFGIAMTSISNILERTVKNSTSEIDSRLNKLTYQYQHGLVKVPNVIEDEKWTIELKKQKEGELNFIVFKATNKASKKERNKKLIEQ